MSTLDARHYPYLWEWVANLGDADVCEDCYMAHHGFVSEFCPECNEPRTCGHDGAGAYREGYDEPLERWPLSELPDGLDISDWTYDPDEYDRCHWCNEPIRQTDWVDPYGWDERYEYLHDRAGGIGVLYCLSYDGELHRAEPNACTVIGHGHTEFTWSSCDGCGSHLGGSRHRLAIHHPREESA